MQVLTGQYPTLYTRKFRVFYTDLNTTATPYKQINLLTLPKSEQVVFVQMQTKSKWTGTGITGQTLRIWQSEQIGTAGASTGFLFTYNNWGTPSNSSGANAWLQQRVNVNAPAGEPMICNTLIPTNLILTSRTFGNNNNALTNGVTDIWVTTIKVP